MNYECLVHMGINSDFTPYYRLGCASTTVCVSLFGSGVDVGVPTLVGKKKRHNIEGDCCNTDLCNQHEPHHGHNKKRQFDLVLDTTTTLPDTTTMVTTTQTMPPATETMPSAAQSIPQKQTTELETSTMPPATQTMPTTTQTMPTTAQTVPTTTQTMPPATQTVTTTTMSTTAQLPVCADIDTLACQRLAVLMKDMCHDSCLVKSCPATCGKCSECYSCPFVHMPNQCFTKTMCDPGEKCYVLEEIMDDGTHGYRVGCLQEQVCTRFKNQAHTIFGRRSDHLLLTMDGNCCDGDLCNHQPLIHTTTPTTTTTTTTHAPITKPTTTKTTTHAHTHHHTVPPTTAFKDGCSYISGHHCPLGFDLVNGKCVALTNRPMTYVEAQHYCRSHCSRLMDNISDRDISHLNTYVQYALYDVNVVHLVRLGAHATHRGHFVWDSTNTEIREVTHTNIGNCVVLTPEAHHHHTQLQDDSCNVRRYSICQAVKH